MVAGGTHPNALLGHFVGGAGTSARFFDHQYIQDLSSCLAGGLSTHITV